MSATDSRRETVRRISQYIVRKESQAPAKSCQMSLIKSVLYNNENKGADLNEIVAQIKKDMGLANFPLRILKNALQSDLKGEGVYEVDGKYFLQPEMYEQMRKKVSERQDVINRFETLVKGKVEEKSKLANNKENLSDLALKTVYAFLSKWFVSESTSIAVSLKNRHQLGFPKSPEIFLDSALSRVENKEHKQILRDAFRELFVNLEPEVGRLIFEILQSYLHIQLLNVDPECKYLERIAFSNKILVLDTNVLMSLFLSSYRKHEGIIETISIAKQLGVKLVMTKATENEWLASLEDSNLKYHTISKERPSILPNLDDPFIQSFFKENLADASLAWNGYYLHLKQIKFMAYEKGIEFWYKKEIELDSLPNKEYFDELCLKVFSCASRQNHEKSLSVVEHDAYHLLLVKKFREDKPSDIAGPSCWFLTLDRTLYCADIGLNQIAEAPFDPPSSFMADMWVSVISPFLGPEISEARLADAFASLMTTNFASVPSTLSAEMIIEVMGKWLPYEKLSDQEVEAILSDALVQKYYHDLQRARIRERDQVEKLTKKLHEKVDEKVFEIYENRASEAETKRFEAEREREEAEREKRKAEQVATAQAAQLLADSKQRSLALRVCLILGVVFAGTGLLVLFLNSLAAGIVIVVAGVTFLLLALGFKHIKIKSATIEIEANQ